MELVVTSLSSLILIFLLVILTFLIRDDARFSKKSCGQLKINHHGPGFLPANRRELMVQLVLERKVDL